MAECHLNLSVAWSILLPTSHRPQEPRMSPSISIRPARPDESRVLHDLAALDSALPLEGDVLVALVDEPPVAALSLDDGRVVAAPFRRTADIVALMRVRAGRGERRRTARPRVALRARLGLAA